MGSRKEEESEKDNITQTHNITDINVDFGSNCIEFVLVMRYVDFTARANQGVLALFLLSMLQSGLLI